jgi:lipopolysaccharide/colanic/teichoic acid biosynthesis glycosyltransferase
VEDDLKDIALNYLKGWFIIDFVSILPLDLILSSASNSTTSGYNRFFRFIRLGKLQKLFRVIKSFQHMENDQLKKI